MHIDDKTIKQLEAYGKIKLTEAQRELAKKDLQEILAMTNTLSELNRDESVQTAYEHKNIMREDIKENSCCRDLMLKNAPSVKDGFFSVPKTVE